MAQGRQITLTAGAAAVLIVTEQGRGPENQQVVLANTGANPASLGGPGVTASGYTLAAGAILTIALANRDTLYAFSTTGTTLQVLTSP